MKKTLIALAVLAASGAAFAQSNVTLTGKLRFAYGDAKAANGAKTTGIGGTDGDWNIAAVEDLGGGMTAGANMALRLRGRDTGADGVYAVTTTAVGTTTPAAATYTSSVAANGARPRDASMYVAGDFGRVTLGAIDLGNTMLGEVTAGGPNYIWLDNGVTLEGSVNGDILSYRTPSMNGFTGTLTLVDAVGGGGSQAIAATQDSSVVSLNYAVGPLSATVGMTTWDKNTAAAPTRKDRTRVSANYDLGVARIGAGFATAKWSTGVKSDEQALSVSAPFGAITLGAVYASSKTSGVAGNNTGYDLAAQYALSKRTWVALQTQSTKSAGAAASATNTRVQLSHSF